MIEFNSVNQEIPYLIFKTKYNEALNAGQKGIEAISISSYNNEFNEVDSRYVNLKFITNDEFIFFEMAIKAIVTNNLLRLKISSG